MSIWYGWSKLWDESQPPSFVLLPILPNWSHLSLMFTCYSHWDSRKHKFENLFSLMSTEFPVLWSSMLSLTLTNDGNHNVHSAIPDQKKIHRLKQTQIITQRKDLKVLPPCRIDSIWASRNSNSNYWFLYIDGVYQIEILYLICKYRCYMLI